MSDDVHIDLVDPDGQPLSAEEEAEFAAYFPPPTGNALLGDWEGTVRTLARAAVSTGAASDVEPEADIRVLRYDAPNRPSGRSRRRLRSAPFGLGAGALLQVAAAIAVVALGALAVARAIGGPSGVEQADPPLTRSTANSGTAPDGNNTATSQGDTGTQDNGSPSDTASGSSPATTRLDDSGSNSSTPPAPGTDSPSSGAPSSTPPAATNPPPATSGPSTVPPATTKPPATTSSTGSATTPTSRATTTSSRATTTTTTAPQPLAVDPDSGDIPLRTGSQLSLRLVVSGGTAPYTWRLTDGPSWASLSSTGTLSLSPTAAGAFPLSVRVTDAGGRVGTANYRVVVTPPDTPTTAAVASSSAGQNN